MELKNIDVSNDEIFSQQECENILEKVKSFYENKLAEKDKEYGILLADRDKLEMYWHNRLKKSDVEVKVWCRSCERWVTDDIQDCYCQCTCNFGEDSDYDCIYEEDINVKSKFPSNKEWRWQYKISEIQYKGHRVRWSGKKQLLLELFFYLMQIVIAIRIFQAFINKIITIF